MRLDEILDRRQRELGKKPESLWVRHFSHIDWSWLMFCACLTLGFVAYSTSVLLPVLAK